MNKYFITLLSFLGVGMLIYFITISGNYPIAYVAGDFISQKSYDEYLVSAVHYYSEANKALKGEEIKDLSKYMPEIRRSILDKIILDSIIEKKLDEILGNELNTMVTQKVEPASQNENFSKYISALYGISFEKVRKIVLEPQARQEILESRLSSEKQDFNTWIADIKKKSKIYIFISDLKWDGSSVAFK